MTTNQLFWTFCCISSLVPQSLFAQQPPWRLAAGTEGRYFSAITVYPNNPDTLYAIGQGFFRSTDRGEHWDSVSNLGATAGALKTDPLSSRIIYASSNGPSGNNVSISTNGGVTWQLKFMGLQCAAPIIEIDPADRRTVYVGVGPSWIMRSSNYGQTWDTVNAPRIQCINDFKIAASNDSVMYAAYSTGIFRSLDKGNSWAPTAFPTYATFLAIDPQNPQKVYAALQSSGNEPRGVYKTTDGGATWSQNNNGLDSLQGIEWLFGDLALNPMAPQELLLGTSGPRYLFKSSDGGALWFEFNGGILAAGHVESITIDTTSRRTYLGTARGIYFNDWMTSVRDRDDLIDGFVLHQNYPNPFNSRTIITYYIPESAPLSVTVYDVLGREIRTLWHSFQSRGFHSVQFDADGLPSGIYIYWLKAGSIALGRKAILLK
jgi:photosystem II stability/assembly factor-like uncharacterized protein